MMSLLPCLSFFSKGAVEESGLADDDAYHMGMALSAEGGLTSICIEVLGYRLVHYENSEFLVLLSLVAHISASKLLRYSSLVPLLGRCEDA